MESASFVARRLGVLGRLGGGCALGSSFMPSGTSDVMDSSRGSCAEDVFRGECIRLEDMTMAIA